MDKANEFQNKSSQEVQETFFLDELPTREDKRGIYYYRQAGLIADHRSTLVLFQYDNMVIATATLNDIEKFPSPKGDYSGALYFEPESIKVFTPVSNEFVNEIFDSEIKFSQVKHKLDHSKADKFLNSLQNVRTIKI